MKSTLNQNDRFIPMFLFFALLTASVIPCSALELTESDNGRDFTISLDETLTVRLPGNPTTAYQWEVLADDPALLKQNGETVFVSDAYRTGTGGQIKILFVPGGIGSTRLKLVYRRPWEKQIPPTQVYEVGLTVSPDKN
jgi:inhibitor of cysteine peptidase